MVDDDSEGDVHKELDNLGKSTVKKRKWMYGQRDEHPKVSSLRKKEEVRKKEETLKTKTTVIPMMTVKEMHIRYGFTALSGKLILKRDLLPSSPITIRKKIPEWKLTDSDRTIESEHPPFRSITIDHGEPPVQIRASPYKIPKPNDSDTNLSSIIQQNNFCNTNLNTIGKKLTRIENQFQKSTITVSSTSTVPSKSDSDKKLKEPIFKPFQVSKTSQKLVHESKSDFAKSIREQLDRIKAASSSSSKAQIAPDTPQSSKIGVLEQDQMSDQTSIASSDIEAFKEEPIPKANKIHWELALPTVKSPLDLTIDNRPSALNQSRYNASSVYEWNLDGMSEYNILGLLQQMTMAANAYKTQSGTSDKAIAEILIAGFTGQLKGDPSHLRDKNAELLHNLRCRTLSEFQSYKTSFFTRLFLRDDANHITWKEKFLAGLPTLLGEKVRNSIKALYDNRIPYDELTYGELVSFINKEGLKIFQDLKLQKRLKWELRKSKQELGSFCKQFNYDPFKTSTSKGCNGECSSKPHRRHYKSRSHRKPFQNFRESSYKKPSRPHKKPNFSKKKEFKPKHKAPFSYKEAICHKCGIKGHTVKYCRMNRKLHELGLDEETLSKVASLLIESSDSESSMSGDSDSLQIMPPRRKDKGKAVLKDTESQETSKEPQSTPSREKLLSSAMPIKSWIEMVEEHEAHYKATTTDDQIKQWMSSITKSPELMLALQGLSQSQISPKREIEKEKPVPKEISKPSSQYVVVSGESSSSQIVLSQPTPSKKSSDWFDKSHFQNILSMEDGFYHTDPFQTISKFFPKG
ncbi:hypothetical protein KPL71_008453 [Citrus sinensis]|uniref:Uncharacterized protein n=1 Tax=Citrus sinensis TaxID=2711 RepID=A0ACB8M7F9_CITSI|nr:hypothetical protein KPL71_008453 [Citrus sinensis]